MFCEQCGTQNPNDSRFCQNCGAPMEIQVTSVAPVAVKEPPDPVKTKKIMMIAGIVVAAIIAIIITIIAISAPKTVVLDDYITVDIYGYNGIGKANLNWDSDLMLEDLSEDLKEDEQTALMLALMAGNLDMELNKTRELMNGETIELVLTVNEELFERMGLKFKLNKTEYAVENLEACAVIDPFEFLNISFEGYNGYAALVMENNAEDEYLRNNITFATDRTRNFAEGDTFNVYIYYSEDDLAENGYILSVSEKEYTATGIAQPQEIDLFDWLALDYTGVDGNGKVIYEKKEVDENNVFLRNFVSFRFSKTNGLTTGDTVTCTASYGYYIPEEYGYIVTSTEKEFVVPQLGTYVTDWSALSAERQAEVMAALQKTVTEYYSKESLSGYLYTSTSIFATSYPMNNFTEWNNIQTTHKFSSNRYTDYYIGIAYTVDLSGNPNEAANGTAHSVAYIRNLVLRPDGTLDAGWEENVSVEGSVCAVSHDLLLQRNLKYHSDVIVSPIS